ncbi:hypothetical protein BGZ93_008001 [Podila epicladia]|nr:hypothetical protein BGZ92_008308 [Podila epicladia]KAG0093157.1 hypothetical protein BGZ93_008001 [Podila epicladia]
MTRPVLHALFHSMASLGYIPFALTSVLIASSTPFVTIPPVGIILLAFVPPLTLFPILCFSYRYLERFAVISLTVQRARIYIMLAGSGLCFLVGAHLIMIHMVANNQNSAYNRMAFTLPETNIARTTNGAATTQLTTTELSSSSTKKSPDITIVALPKDDDPSTPKGEQTNFNALIPSYLSDFLVNVQTNDNIEPQPSSVEQEQNSGVQSALVKRDDLSNVPFAKSLIPTYLLNTESATPGVQPMLNPHLETQEEVLRVGPLQTYSVGEVKASDATSASSESIIIYTVDSSPSPEGSVPAYDQFSVPGSIQEELQSSSQPQLNTAPALPVVLPLSSLESQEKNENAHAKDSESGPIFIHSKDVPAGYNLAGVHLMLFIAANGFLIFLLATLFLGVLIMTEFVLDREDDDLVQLKWLYWGRVIGIATATVVSAVHGSFLSGYVLLDGQSDWIAKATVGTIFVYWVSMTWLMNRITGPLPY